MERNNILLFLLDSCRYDVFEAANAPNMKAIGKLQKAYSFACFTLPSLVGYLQSWPPMLGVDRNYLFPDIEDSWAPAILKNRGYCTIWLSPSPVFYLFDGYTHGALTRYFDYYKCLEYAPSKDGLVEMANDVGALVESEKDRPIFMLMLLLETHYPYLQRPFDLEHPEVNFKNQKEAVEYDDNYFPYFLNALKNTGRKTHVIITADHGDLHGPEKYGHDPRKGHCYPDIKLFEIPFVEGEVNAT